MKRATETSTSSKTKNAFPPGKTDLLQSLHPKKKLHHKGNTATSELET